MENKKKTMLIAVASILTLLVIVGGATYAYFQAQAGTGSSVDVNLISGTTDSLTFIEGDGINIKLTMDNFSQGAGNPSDDTTTSATLIANNTSNTAYSRYNVYFIIDENTFDYTTTTKGTEMLLKVTDPNGNEVTSVTGLAYNTELGGFDITNRNGGFLISADYEISASLADGATGLASTTQNWKFEVTVINLDTSQNDNMGKSLSGRVFLTTDQEATYKVAVANSFENTTTTYSSYSGTLAVEEGTTEIESYYFGYEKTTSTTAMNTSKVLRLGNMLASADTVSYVKTDSPTYTYSGLEANTTYTIYAYTEDKYGFKSNVYQTDITTAPYDVPVINSVSLSSTLTTITAEVNATKGSEEIDKYWYKINNEEWIETTSNTYTFEGLADTSTYTVRVKAVDIKGEESIEWYDTIDTVTYILPSVTTATTTTTYNSITVNTTAQGGTNNLSKYYYSIDGGAYVEGSASYTFLGLSESKEYAIKVKVADTEDRESVEYELSASTIAYVLPKVTATTSVTTNSITITTSGTNGDGTIATYYYSKDNGSNWETSTSNTFTFSSLTPGATYPIAVKVVDNNDRESSLYTTSATTEYILPTVIVSATDVTHNSITVTAKGTNGSGTITTYYYSINNGTYQSSTSNSHTFTSLSETTTYTIKVKVLDNNNKESDEYSFTATTEIATLVAYIKSQYTSDGTNGLYYHNGVGTYSNAELEAGDNSYRYAGDDPDNYVCFGSTATTCPTDNLYRIIGVFVDQVKLIKADFATTIHLGATTAGTSSQTTSSWSDYKGSKTRISLHYWIGSNSNQVNIWSASTLNTSALNTTYYNYLGSTWTDKIATTTWKVGGNTSANMWSVNAKIAYTNEIVNPAESTTYSDEIGLMYVSDYMYGAEPTYWSTYASSYASALSANWMAIGGWDWTILRRSDASDVFVVRPQGSVVYESSILVRGVRPVFYLKSTVAYDSGIGTSENPIRLSVQ